jgi:hypothetical protein
MIIARASVVAIIAIASLQARFGNQEADPGVSIGPNVHLSRTASNVPMGEVSIAADPTEAATLLACVVGYASETNRRIVYAFRSLDRGTTWGQVFDTATFGDNADPACAFGRDGLAYLGFLTFGADTDGFVLFRSTDGGARWAETTRVRHRRHAVDRESIVVDTTGSRHQGTVYMNATTDRKPINPPPAYVSGVGLWTFHDRDLRLDGPAQRLSSATSFIAAQGNSVILSDGTVAWLLGELTHYHPTTEPLDPQFENTPGRPIASLSLMRSTDFGESLEPGIPIGDWYLPSPSRLGPAQVSLAVDPSPAFKDRLYAVWPDERTGRSEIYLASSVDRGRTWSAPFVVSDDPSAGIPAGNHAMPSVAVNRDGVVGVMWYDRRNVSDNLGWDVLFRVSFDGGETFLPSQRVSDTPIRFQPDLALGTIGRSTMKPAAGGLLDLRIDVYDRQLFGGDYAGMTADAGGTFHAAWIDHRTGTPQIWTAAVAVRGLAVVNGSEDLATWTDASDTVLIRAVSTQYHPRSGEATLNIVVDNRGSQPVDYPLKIRVVRLTSDVAERVEILDAENGRPGMGAVLSIPAPAPNERLLPGARTRPQAFRFRLSNIGSFRDSQRFRAGLVKLQGRVLVQAVRRSPGDK